MARCDNCQFTINIYSENLSKHYLASVPEHKEFINEKLGFSLSQEGASMVRSQMKTYCNYCAPYFQELEIKRLNKISMKELETKETFEDFIEKSRLWHAEQLNSKDKEILELKLQLKEKEIENLNLKLQALEAKMQSNLNIEIENNNNI